MKSSNIFDLNRPLTQYIIGLAFNFILLIILLLGPVSFRNLQLPEGRYKDNIWRGTDVRTYVIPARNFLETGGFLVNGRPDCKRTIGYPFLIACF